MKNGLKKRNKVRRNLSESPHSANGLEDGNGREPIIEPPDREAHLREINKLSRNRRGPLYGTALILSLVSLAILIVWIAGTQITMPLGWFALDIGLSVFFAAEFFTRSGLRWNWVGYMQTRFFDFIAIIPALALVYYGIPYQGIWIWIILAARAIRAIDRILGDGFVRRNTLALIEGFEEEITDRVLLRIIARVEADLYRGRFSHGVAQSLDHNRSPLLERIQEAFPREGLGANLAHLAGLDAAAARAEERIFETIVNILDSPEVDKTVRESIDSVFITMSKRLEGGAGGNAWELSVKGGHQEDGFRVACCSVLDFPIRQNNIFFKGFPCPGQQTLDRFWRAFHYLTDLKNGHLFNVF